MVVWDLHKNCWDDLRDDPICDPNSTAIASEMFFSDFMTPHNFLPLQVADETGFTMSEAIPTCRWFVCWWFVLDPDGFRVFPYDWLINMFVYYYIIYVSYIWYRFIACFDFCSKRIYGLTSHIYLPYHRHTTLFLGRWASSMMSLSNIGIPSWNQVNRTIQATDFEQSALDESPTSFQILRDRVLEIGDMWRC